MEGGTLNQIAISPRVLERQRVYSKADILSDKTLMRFCIGILLMVIAAVMYTWIHVKVVEIGYDINALNRMKQQLMAENKAASAELALLRNPQRLEKIATEQLGLKQPAETQFVYFNTGKNALGTAMAQIEPQ